MYIIKHVLKGNKKIIKKKELYGSREVGKEGYFGLACGNGYRVSNGSWVQGIE